MALKRPAESPSFEQYREMMREEILDPLRIQLSAVEAKADESLRGVASLQDQTRTLDGRLGALEAQTAAHAKSISAIQDRRSTGTDRSNGSFPGGDRASSNLNSALDVLGGFKRDTQRRELEAKAAEIMTHLGAMPTVKKIYAPGKRASVAYVQFQEAAGGTARDNLWAAFTSFKEESYEHAGSPLWFGPHKSQTERQIASFTARALRTARLLDADAEHLEGDYRQGIAWLGSHRFAGFSSNPDLPNVSLLSHELGKTEFEVKQAWIKAQKRPATGQ